MKKAILGFFLFVSMLLLALNVSAQSPLRKSEKVFKYKLPINDGETADITAYKIENTADLVTVLSEHKNITSLKLLSNQANLIQTEGMVEELSERFPKRNFELLYEEGNVPKGKPASTQSDRVLAVIGGSTKMTAALAGVLLSGGNVYAAVASAAYQMAVNYYNIAYRVQIDSVMTSKWISFTGKSDLNDINVSLWVDKDELKLESRSFKNHLGVLFKDIVVQYPNIKVLHVATESGDVNRIEAEAEELLAEYAKSNPEHQLKVKVRSQRVFSSSKSPGTFKVAVRNALFNGAKMLGTLVVKETFMHSKIKEGLHMYQSGGVINFLFLFLLNQSMNGLTQSVRQKAEQRGLLTKVGSRWNFFYKMALTQPIVILKLFDVTGASLFAAKSNLGADTIRLLGSTGLKIPSTVLNHPLFIPKYINYDINMDVIMLLIPISFAMIAADTYFYHERWERWGQKSQKIFENKVLDSKFIRWINVELPQLKEKFGISSPAMQCHMIFQ